MYGGLFGDLPPTKKGKSEGESKRDGSSETTPAPSTEGGGSKPSSLAAASATDKPKAAPSTSVVSRLGIAGTSMAFIPTAALKRTAKRAAPSSLSTNSSNHITATSDIAATARTTTTFGNSTADAPLRSFYAPLQVSKQEGESDTYDASSSAVAQRSGDNSSCRKAIIGSTQPSQAPFVETCTAERALVCDNSNDTSGAVHGDDVQDNRGGDREQQQQQQQRNSISNTDQRKRREVEEDPYDPFLPNDLLEYWERQTLQRAWEEQEKLRHQLMEQQQQQQQQQALVEERPVVERVEARGRGRGGLSNLPAWLVEKQRKEASLSGGVI